MHGGDKRVAGGNEIQDDRATVFAVQARSIQFWLSDITVSTRRMPRAQKKGHFNGKNDPTGSPICISCQETDWRVPSSVKNRSNGFTSSATALEKTLHWLHPRLVSEMNHAFHGTFAKHPIVWNQAGKDLKV